MLSLRLAGSRTAIPQPGHFAILQIRAFSSSPVSKAAARSTLSTTWAPTGGIATTGNESGHDKLVRAGFLRQAHSGIFQLLPLGLRVQDKIEKLIDKHMRTAGASRLSLSTISSEELWRKSGRLDLVSSELFRLGDRREVPLVLSPTHEEEITTLVAGTLKSYKDLPIRLYQITRKYRDERRPRHGLLRSREFLMKDLYTFDLTTSAAIETYREISAAYKAFFSELKLPYVVAEASSGDMGGDLSHEYHLVSAVGEDTVVNCTSCGYAANDEVVTARPLSETGHAMTNITSASQFNVWRGVSKDKKVLVNAWYPQTVNGASAEDLNLHAVKSAFPAVDTSIENASAFWLQEFGAQSKAKVVNVVDARLVSAFDSLRDQLPLVPKGFEQSEVEHSFVERDEKGAPLLLLRLADGDGCPRCDEGTLKIHKALEVGHTFHLGTRYSAPLDACVSLPRNEIPGATQDGLVPGSRVPVQMGCHGVGVSRIFGAVAEVLADEKGLNWPRSIAPFEVAIIPTPALEKEAEDLYDTLARSKNPDSAPLDVVLDDRKLSFGWKMKDADLVGYPVVVIMGKSWREGGLCEVQCRRLCIKEKVSVTELPGFISDIVRKL